MDAKQIDQFLMIHSSKFPAGSLGILRDNLANIDSTTAMAMATQLKDPTVALILSICIGCWGIDRFYIDSIGIGIGKLVTGGGCGIWWIIDIFLIQDATRQKNYEKFMMTTSAFGNRV